MLLMAGSCAAMGVRPRSGVYEPASNKKTMSSVTCEQRQLCVVPAVQSTGRVHHIISFNNSNFQQLPSGPPTISINCLMASCKEKV
jgi:hypothetical protein